MAEMWKNLEYAYYWACLGVIVQTFLVLPFATELPMSQVWDLGARGILILLAVDLIRRLCIWAFGRSASQGTSDA